MSDTSYEMEPEIEERVIEIARVAKVVRGGRRFAFRVTVVAGDKRGKVGIGVGKANAVPDAMNKATERARKNMTRVALYNATIPHEVLGKTAGARVLLKPASPGTGVIAGGGVRAVLELAGIRDVLAKSLGTTNPINMARATVDGLQRLRRPEDVARARGLSIRDVLPARSAGADRARPEGQVVPEGGTEEPAAPAAGGPGDSAEPNRPGGAAE